MPENHYDQQFFFDEQPMRRINNTLNPLQAVKIIEDAIEECKHNTTLTKDLKTLKEWVKSRN